MVSLFIETNKIFHLCIFIYDNTLRFLYGMNYFKIS
jgi:hypothetical protein